MQSSTNQKWSAGTEGGTSGNTGVQFTTGSVFHLQLYKNLRVDFCSISLAVYVYAIELQVA